MTLKMKDPQITLEMLYGKLDDFQMYRYYLGIEFVVGQAFCNPFRKDHHPSCSIYLRDNGQLGFKDFADDSYRCGSGIGLVMILYNLTLSQAMEKVAKDFNIRSEDSQEYKQIVSAWIKPDIVAKPPAIIQVTTKKWTTADLQYWADYGINRDTLKREEIYCVAEWFLNHQKQYIKPGEKCYAYKFPENKFKIYAPDRPKCLKFPASNISCSTVEGLEKLNGHDKLLLTKSRKDRLSLQFIFPDMEILNTQNESSSSFTDDFIQRIRSKIVYIGFDNDQAGKRASVAITKKFGYRHVNVPDSLYEKEGIKDFADWYKSYGKKPIIEHFKLKKLVEC